MSNKKKYIILSIAGVLILLSGLASFNLQLIKAYYYRQKHDHFSKGDKVYAYKYFINDVSVSKLELMRLIKSATSSEFRLISSGKTIVDDSLEKYKSSYIGTYIDYKFLPYIYKNKKAIQCIYSIEPNWKVVNKNDTIPDKLPKNFEFADSSFYLSWATTADKDLNAFK
ncbi:hypothetical protein [Mucilaginibacter lappiensis]|uniref:Uncharacterized protein n=1 Tax=Mucilaginibacter lappiensis TaxID=354630 RepID=A0A1N6UWS6_9SPHI|nr:hypothetical protein [Mucilaginibacter lappiensis]MBB6108966.1 hypothetical protein [Mucilaginibacter lappiensis]MBB6130559.1 hypothetical protein [Mucilaginibacter lappiensis]SIQ69706.1 hypothetical protein SAMN05421821_103199 [Mucilaginibacter lappiensis]